MPEGIYEEMRFVSSFSTHASVWTVSTFERRDNSRAFNMLNEGGYLFPGQNLDGTESDDWYHADCSFFNTTESAEFFAGDDTFAAITKISVFHLTDAEISARHASNSNA